jgi:pyruvyltransferase
MTASSSAPTVDVFAWKPDGPTPVYNFGDMLGPIIVAELLNRLQLDPARARRDAQLLSVGSVLHFARAGAVVWGAGRNGKVPDALHPPVALDVRAVRGPLTRQFLIKRGYDVPEVFGDPALLTPLLFPRLLALEKRVGVLFVPNLNDRFQRIPRGVQTLDPRRPLLECLETIASSELVVGSSLHGLVVAEALGIPAGPVVSQMEHPFKYQDYYLGTGRSFEPAKTIRRAIKTAGALPEFDSAQLLKAFPADLWHPSPVG